MVDFQNILKFQTQFGFRRIFDGNISAQTYVFFTGTLRLADHTIQHFIIYYARRLVLANDILTRATIFVTISPAVTVGHFCSFRDLIYYRKALPGSYRIRLYGLAMWRETN